VVGAQSYRLSTVDAHTVALNQFMGKLLDIIHNTVLWHFAMCTSVNCLTYILGMMLNCIRTERNDIEKVCIWLGNDEGANVISK